MRNRMTVPKTIPAILLFILLPAGLATANAGQEEFLRKSSDELKADASHRVRPAYPPLAKATRVAGTVIVEVMIDEEGNVIKAKALSGHPLLKDAAVAAAKGWKFAPATRSDEPVKVVGALSFNFVLEVDTETTQKLTMLKEEISANPGSADAHYELGDLYSSVGRDEEAVGALQEVVQIKPDSVKARLKLGDLLRGMYRNEEAVESYLEALKVEPANVDAATGLSAAYLQLGRQDDAINVLQRAVQANPKNHSLYISLGQTLAKAGRYDEAITALEKGLSLRPADKEDMAAAQVHVLIGEAYQGAGQLSKAVAAFKNAASLSPQWEDVRVVLLRAYLKMGDKKAAMGEYEQLKAINPALAKAMLKEIQAQ